MTSDCDAVGDVSGSHHYTNPVNGSAISLKAGTDMDCGYAHVRLGIVWAHRHPCL